MNQPTAFVTTDEKQGLRGQQMDRNMQAHTHIEVFVVAWPTFLWAQI